MNKNSLLKNEIDSILEETGLLERLGNYGEVKIVGSYYLDLLVWRDIDINVIIDDNEFDKAEIYDLGNFAIQQLEAEKIVFKDNRSIKWPREPKGIYMGIIGIKNWKFDIWFLDKENYQKSIQLAQKLKSDLDQSEENVYEIKYELSKEDGFRKDYFSWDIYRYIIDENIKDNQEFLEQYK
jgi:hypothetical protein